MNETIKTILENSQELQKEYRENVFFRISIDSIISDGSPANIFNIIHLLSNELKYQFDQKKVVYNDEIYQRIPKTAP